VVQLVTDLVQRFLEHVRVELDATGAGVDRQQAGAVHRVEVPPQERGRHPCDPLRGAAREELFGALLAAHGAPGDHLGDRGACRVVERTEHAGDVAQRRSLEAAFAERARGFAFEIEDDEVATRVEHLTEV
jgi:hypothetical protein